MILLGFISILSYQKKCLNTFFLKATKNYAHNIFQEKSEMRAFQSQVLFWQGFFGIDSGLLKNGHFKNVQNRVANFKPGKFLSFLFSIN